jgi:hypothetical protein
MGFAQIITRAPFGFIPVSFKPICQTDPGAGLERQSSSCNKLWRSKNNFESGGSFIRISYAAPQPGASVV